MDYYRPFEITITNAKDLKNTNFISKMRSYVVVSIVSINSSSRQETPISKLHGTSPSWDFGMRFYVEESKLHQNHLILLLKLRCRQTIGGDTDIGEVCVPLKKLFDAAEEEKNIPVAGGYQVITPAGKPRGVLRFSYCFRKTVSVRRVEEESLCRRPAPSAPDLPPEGNFFRDMDMYNLEF